MTGDSPDIEHRTPAEIARAADIREAWAAGLTACIHAAGADHELAKAFVEGATTAARTCHLT